MDKKMPEFQDEEEREQWFRARYPDLFRQSELSIQESCMPWGICCGMGWTRLLNTVCEEIENHYENNKLSIKYWEKWKAEGKGVQRPRPEPIPPFEFTQIKEKFAQFRLYNVGGDDFTDGVISLAESMSGYICEICGNPGSIFEKNYWLTALCPSCIEKREADDKETTS